MAMSSGELLQPGWLGVWGCGVGVLVRRPPGAGVSMRVDVQAAPLSLLFGDFLEHCCGLAPPLGLCLRGY